MQKIFDGKKEAKLGTEKNPAKLTVKTKKKAKELKAVCDEHGWVHTIEVVADGTEDTTDLEILQNPPQTRTVEKTPGRNDPCPCGSGQKYKKCCGK